MLSMTLNLDTIHDVSLAHILTKLNLSVRALEFYWGTLWKWCHL